jgi:DNA-binding NtrC family response regulator
MMGRGRGGKSQISQFLDQATFPIYIVDATRKIVYVNTACCAWLGIEGADELIGLRCDYHSDPRVAESPQLGEDLCPPPEAFMGKEIAAPILGASAGERRPARFIPLSEDPIACPGVLVLVSHCPETAGGQSQFEAEEAIRLHDKIRTIRESLKKPFQLEQLLGESEAAERIRRQVELAAEGRPNVVVCGPPGSGREHVARTIHYARHSPEQRALVPLTCQLLDAELLQSTIDGLVHRSDAILSQQSITLLLLEADQLPQDAQSVLMDFLKALDLELQVLATTRIPLVEMSVRRQYRTDLAYRLSTLQIELAALTDRPRDIPILAQAAVERVNARGGRQMTGLTLEAIDRLAEFPWTGNTDELFEVIETAHRVADGPYIQLKDLPDRVRLWREAATRRRPEPETIDLDRFLNNIETELIQRALRQSAGNKAQAAKLLGINRARLLRRLEQLGLIGER